jgi:hypothetical protein
MQNDDLGVRIIPSTFGLWDVECWGKIKYREVPLIVAQALAYCLEHAIRDKDRGWEFEEPLG